MIMNARIIMRVRSSLQAFSRHNSQNQGSKPTPSSSSEIKDVPGLSSACVASASQLVGPGVDPKKSGAYKVPEYYLYNNMTYFEAEIEMQQYRNPQPSAIRK